MAPGPGPSPGLRLDPVEVGGEAIVEVGFAVGRGTSSCRVGCSLRVPVDAEVAAGVAVARTCRPR
jgi:hypothetical protein